MSIKKKSFIRNNSAIELLRIILLCGLLFNHIGLIKKTLSTEYVDIEILQSFSTIGVDCFAIITGLFVFHKTPKNLFSRNISRLLLVIVFSIIIASIIVPISGNNFNDNLSYILSGSAHSWYLYSILVVYAVAPFIGKYINKIKPKYLILIAVSIMGLIWLSKIGIGRGIVFGLQSEYTYIHIFSMALVGNAISRMKFNVKIAISLLLLVLSIKLLPILIRSVWGINFYPSADQDDIHELMLGHASPITVLFAFVTIWMAFNCKWYSKHINSISSNLYFIYEYHWLFYMLFKSVFKNEIETSTHIWTYIIILITTLSLVSLSYGITFIQRRYWNPFFVPKINNLGVKIIKKII